MAYYWQENIFFIICELKIIQEKAFLKASFGTLEENFSEIITHQDSKWHFISNSKTEWPSLCVTETDFYNNNVHNRT